jgi:pimeloyl-ACP methyl ester carboxylesterase
MRWSYWMSFVVVGLSCTVSQAAETAKKELVKLEATEPKPTKAFHGFKQELFKLNGVGCRLVYPKKAAEGKPWIWRARFFGHQPQTDIALLNKGFHVAYTEAGGLFGAPEAVARWDRFHRYLTTTKGFAQKPALEGMSRGGLIIYNWAIANPDKVACIYGDAPVCDFKSWPGGLGKGKGSAGTYKQCLKVYGLTPEQGKTFKGNPIDNLEPLAKAKVPILHVCGAADNVVPMPENSDIIEKRYKALGGSIRVISKEGVGHHPHSLKDPEPIVSFVLKHTVEKQPNSK